MPPARSPFASVRTRPRALATLPHRSGHPEPHRETKTHRFGRHLHLAGIGRRRNIVNPKRRGADCKRRDNLAGNLLSALFYWSRGQRQGSRIAGVLRKFRISALIMGAPSPMHEQIH